ncbi:MAG: alpha/beta fold hydrolase [Phycisphaerae bacterium]
MHTPLSPPQPAEWKLSDGYVARGRVWTPPRAHGTIIYLHGIQSHGGWYEWSASLLADCGWRVILPDRRGSGLNEQARSDAPNIDRWLLDIDEIAALTVDAAAPARLIGLSWGGKVATALALRDPNPWRQLLLITPGIFPAVDVGFWQRMRIGRALLTRSTTLFEIPLADPALFTDNPLGQQFIARDPLKLTHATARFLFHSSRLDQRLRRVARGAVRVPTTLLLAGKEQIICNDPTERWLRRIAAATPRVVRFDNDAHTLEFSADLRAYERFLRDWAKV